VSESQFGWGTVVAARVTKATSEKPARRSRGSLSRKQFLDAARRLVERDGLQALSMPALAHELDSGVTSVYWYFKGKEELVDALVLDVLAEVQQLLPPLGNGPWEEELLVHFSTLRRLLVDHPMYREMVAYDLRCLLKEPMLPVQRVRIEAGFAVLGQAGLTRQQSITVLSACQNYTRGFVILETSAMDAAKASVGGVSDELTRLDDAQFISGLRLILAGARQMLESADAPAEDLAVSLQPDSTVA